MSGPIQLTPAQQAAAIDRIADSLALRSGAGCGKTFVLALRYIHLLRSASTDSDPLSELVALTFTDKAALEMSQRVRKMLLELGARSEGEFRARVQGWIDRLGEARIGTIHSFCSALLRANAIEAGIDPSFAVCSDALQARRLLSEAADDACLEAVESEQTDVAELLTRMAYPKVVELVVDLAELRTTCRLEDYQDPRAIVQRWERLRRETARAEWARLAADVDYRAELDRAEAHSCSDPHDRLADYRSQQVRLVRGLLDDPACRTAQTMDLLDDAPGNIGSGKAWGGKDMLLSVRSGLKNLVARAMAMSPLTRPLNELDEQAAAFLATLTGLARRTIERYRLAKRSAGLLDFTDLLDHAGRMLRDNPALRTRLAGQIRQLLIDECQDTDAFQVELLMTLVDPQRGLKGEVPQGRLFLVGDAKQSIYRFRGAQLEVFEDLCQRLGPDRQEDLDLSFRSHAGVVEFVNHVFAPLMGPAYSPIRARREVLPAEHSVEILLARRDEGPIDSADQADRAQAAAVAQRIRRMVDDGERRVWDAQAGAWRAVRWGDVAILFARMTNSLLYERELQRMEVPYYVLSGMGFFQQQEVFDVLNALRAIDNPLDDLALLGVLRSSLVGLDDNVLLHLAMALRPPYFPALLEEVRAGRTPLASVLGGPRSRALGEAVAMIHDLHRRKDAVGIDRTLGELLERTAYEAVLLAQFQGKRMLGNVRMLLARAAAAAGQGTCLADFLAEMDEFVAAEQRHEQAAVEGEAEDVVRVLTIHKAKGLEFPVVIVPDLNVGRRSNSPTLLQRRDWGLTLKVKPEDEEDKSQPLSFLMANRLEEQDQLREDIRKYYVALTRAQDFLVLAGAAWRTREGAFQRAGSFVSNLDGVLGLSRAMDAARQTGQADVPYGKGFRARLTTGPGQAKQPGLAPSDGARLQTRSADAEDLGRRIVQRGLKASLDRELELLIDPLPPSVGRVELAVTALVDFDRCPQLYRWRYELQVDAKAAARPPSGLGPDDAAAVDAATMGTILHRCMELLDFAAPQDARALADRALADLEMQGQLLVGVAAELEPMLQRLRAHALMEEVASARQVRRELDFLLAQGRAVLRGQIDLLFEDRAGRWRLVDYKSDRVSTDQVARHAEGYQLQLLVYALAAWRFHGAAPADARLYFLRPGTAHELALSESVLGDASRRLERLTGELIAARRSGRFGRNAGEACAFCPYRALCR